MNPPPTIPDPKLTPEEARAAARWIRGHRPRGYEALRVGAALDRAVRKLRHSLTQHEDSEKWDKARTILDAAREEANRG